MTRKLSEIQARYLQMGIGDLPEQARTRAAQEYGLRHGVTTERGMRSTPENSMKSLYRKMYVDQDLRSAILDVREMDRLDPRVKKIHARMARTAVKGGLRLKTGPNNKRLLRAWDSFHRRLGLHRQEKLESDCRGLVMEGNLPLQWVFNQNNQIVNAIRMPTETIVPQVGPHGVFDNAADAYHQVDLTVGGVIARFALWQLAMVRLSPDNYDDFGALGRPYLDATRGPWKKLVMTEEDLVIRRKTRAPLRRVHQLETADQDFFDAYKEEIENDQYDQTSDFFIKGKGQVSGLQGDANLDQIADVAHLLTTFFAGAPAPKGLWGYTDGLSRDILEDLKRDYYEEIDALQDTLSFGYYLGFRLELLLQGINPDRYDFDVVFKERRTDTPNQRADLALKYQAIGASRRTQFETAGVDPDDEKERLEAEANDDDPYPTLPEEGSNPRGRPNVSVTPGNARKGESATTVSTRSGK